MWFDGTFYDVDIVSKSHLLVASHIVQLSFCVWSGCLLHKS